MDDEATEAMELATVEKPDAVTKAEGEIRRYGLTLTGVGAGAIGAWFLQAFLMGFPFVPLGWLGLFLLLLVLAFFFPQTRKARLAREVQRHWDEARVRSLLESSGASTDPRLRSAERMVRRIDGHPGATEEIRRLASSLLDGLRQVTHDQRATEVVLESGRERDEGGGNLDSLRDSLDYLEARAGRLLGTLAELHSAVVRRDATEVAGVLDQANEALRKLRALDEVDRFLEDGEAD